MLIVHIQVHVKLRGLLRRSKPPLALENAPAQRAFEPGVARFEVGPSRLTTPPVSCSPKFTRTPWTPPPRTRKTAHYQKWRDTVAPMMAEPRAPLKFSARVSRVAAP